MIDRVTDMLLYRMETRVFVNTKSPLATHLVVVCVRVHAQETAPSIVEV